MTYREAMERYGIDRPDTRYGLKTPDISELAAKTEFGVFKDGAREGQGAPQVRLARRASSRPSASPAAREKLTRKITDGYTEFVKTLRRRRRGRS